MNQGALSSLRFEPIYQYRLWGGRRLGNLHAAPLPGDGPIGEAWLLSDRAECNGLPVRGNHSKLAERENPVIGKHFL